MAPHIGGNIKLSVYLAIVTSLAGAAASATAAPVLYNITFTGASPTPTGSFLYDAASPHFSSFIVNWHGIVFDMTATANSPALYGACDTSAPDAADSFAFLNGSRCGTLEFEWGVFRGPAEEELIFRGASAASDFVAIDIIVPVSNTFPDAGGSFSISQATPEPSTLALLFGGGALLAWRRNRRSRNQPVSTDPKRP